MKIMNTAVIGLGGRGLGMMIDVLLPMENVKITAVCDVYEDRCRDAANAVLEKKGNEAKTYTDYRKLLDSETLDAVYIATSWQTHFEIAIYALEKGVPVACEVSPEFSMDQCWDLVKTW